MRRILASIVILAVLAALVLPALAGRTVYITKTGKKYHVSSCHYLRQSKIAIDIDKAWDRGFRPCKVCRPGSPAPPEKKEEVKDDAPSLIAIDLIRVIDGDTIKALVLGKEESIRYIGIDTPEMNFNSDDPPDPWAELATEFNKKLLKDRDLYIELDIQERDRYKRILAYVYAKDEDTDLMVNAQLLRYGYAMLLTIPPNVKYVKRFKAAQKLAREEELGIWGE